MTVMKKKISTKKPNHQSINLKAGTNFLLFLFSFPFLRSSLASQGSLKTSACSPRESRSAHRYTQSKIECVRSPKGALIGIKYPCAYRVTENTVSQVRCILLTFDRKCQLFDVIFLLFGLPTFISASRFSLVSLSYQKERFSFLLMLVKSYPHSTMYFLRKYIFFDLAEKSFFSIFLKNRKTHFVTNQQFVTVCQRGSTLDLKPLRRLRIRGFWSGQPLTYITRYNIRGSRECFPCSLPQWRTGKAPEGRGLGV